MLECFYTFDGGEDCDLAKPGQTVTFDCPPDQICDEVLILGEEWGPGCAGAVLWAQSCQCMSI